MPPLLVSLLWVVALALRASLWLETWPLLGLCFQVLQLRSCKPHHWGAEALLQRFCQRPWEAVWWLLAPSAMLTFSSSSAHPQLGQDLICWPQTGGGVCWGEKAFANLLLNHSAISDNVRLLGAQCTEVTYPDFARQLRVVVQGEVDFLARLSSCG